VTTELATGVPYPPAPADVPADLTKPTGAYTRRAWLASLAVLVFVAGYLGLTWWFGRVTWKLVQTGLGGGSDAVASFLLALAPAFLFLFLFKGLFSIRRGMDPSLVEVTAAEQPQLFDFVHRVARDAGAPAPHRIFLSPRVNAAVFYDLSLRNLLLPTRKNLEIGLGLVNVLSLDELKAVIAHEFGHFAQRTMAVGRWVYTAQQVAGHIVAARGWLDGALDLLSRFDLRIAWIGWIMRLLVWSIRAVLDTAFRGILLAQRALGRHMEFQADLVAVSLTGSDSLVHGLHKLGMADSAAERAVSFAHGQLMQERGVEDLFALQTRFLERIREIFDDEEMGRTPRRPDSDRAAHRVFEDQLAQPPRMWSTHPPNREREENAKARYLPSTLDERSSWSLFADPEALRRRLTSHLLGQMAEAEGREVPEIEPLDESLARVDSGLDKPFLDRRYRGAYLGRSVVRATEDADGLCDPLPEGEPAVRAALDGLYPEALADELEALRQLEQEAALLGALKDGILDAPGGVIRHRGQEIPRRQLDEVIAGVEAERDSARVVVDARDRACRAAHRAAARALGRGWEAYHAGLVALLHYASHSEADLEDAAGWLHNHYQVVIADGRVTRAERRRLLDACRVVYLLLEGLWRARGDVRLPDAVAKELEIDGWSAALPKEFGFGVPTEHNLGDWLAAVQSWIGAFGGPLQALDDVALEQLLATEDHLALCFRDGVDPGDAPAPATVPEAYWTRPVGSERERQKRLGLWDRFVLAEGWGPGALRLLVALAVLTPALLFSGQVGFSYVTALNGLGIPVDVTVGGSTQHLRPGVHTRFKERAKGSVAISARTRDGRLIEEFTESLSNPGVEYIYNVASASPLVEWTEIYGSAAERPPRFLGAPRWHRSKVDHVLEEPPGSISTSGAGGTRDVLSEFSDKAPQAQLNALGGQPEEELVRAHVRWDPTDDPRLGVWLILATRGLPDFEQLLRQRIGEAPGDVMLRRLEMDLLDREAACEARIRDAGERPEDPDALYLRARCLAEGPEQAEAFADGHRRFPDHPWLAMAAGLEQASEGRWAEALKTLEPLPARIPSAAEWFAIDIARIRRLVAGGSAADLSDLLPFSAMLRNVVDGEEPQPPHQDGWGAWRLLAKGELSLALDEAASPEERAELLRLAAASQGASPALIREAFELPTAAGVGQDSLWATAALALREGRDPGPFLALGGELGLRPDQLRMLEVLDADALRAEPEAAMGRLRQGHNAFLQGQALVMGIVLLQDEAPPRWRQEARALLFDSERPYFLADR